MIFLAFVASFLSFVVRWSMFCLTQKENPQNNKLHGMEQLSRSPQDRRALKKDDETQEPAPRKSNKKTHQLASCWSSRKAFPPINFSCCSIYRILADTQAKHSHGFLYCKSHQFGQCPRKKQKKIPTSYSQNQTDKQKHTHSYFLTCYKAILYFLCVTLSLTI